MESLAPATQLTLEEVESYRLRLADGSMIRVPPLDELGAYDRLPVIPDATVTIHYEVLATPIGVVRIVLDVRDGEMVEARAVEAFDRSPEEHADDLGVAVRIDWSRHLDWRSGRASLLEAAEGAEIFARWQVLLLVHGLTQQEEWYEPLRRLTPVSP